MNVKNLPRMFRLFLTLHVATVVTLYLFIANQIYLKRYLSHQSTSPIVNNNNTTTPSPRLNACILVLCREDTRTLKSLLTLLRQFEYHFNQHHHYPYIIFSPNRFSAQFRRAVQQETGASTRVEFGLLHGDEWRVPTWVNRARLRHSLTSIKFGLDYRLMCRFYSGFFFRHELTLKYDYFMRLDDDSRFNDYIETDPFESLALNQTRYGFVIAANEMLYTIPTLWTTVREWANKRGLLPSVRQHRQRQLSFVSNDGGRTLSADLCFFYNNFEVADFALFRSQSYVDYFEYLERAGGFFYERWVSESLISYKRRLFTGEGHLHSYLFIIDVLESF